MIDKQDFKAISKDMQIYDKQRESIIHESRILLKLSKQLIYSLHRNNLKEANNLHTEIKKQKHKLDNISHKNTKLQYEGSYHAAVEEYVEALCFYEFINKKKIPTRIQLGSSTEDYLAGLCDLTGELSRRAVNLIIRKKNKEAEKIKNLVEELYGEFLKFNLRNGNLRKKYDSIKYNLKRLEEMMYDIKIKKN